MLQSKQLSQIVCRLALCQQGILCGVVLTRPVAT